MNAYLLALGIAVFGAALGFLGMTAASTEAGGAEHAGLFTALVTATIGVGSAAGTALAPRLSHGRGTLRVVQFLQIGAAGALAVGGVLLTLGAPTMPVLVAVAIPVGFAGGVEVVLRVPFARLLVGQTSTSQAYARLGVVSGVAYAAGSVTGGVLLPLGSLGLGLVANAVLLIPLIVLLLRMDRAQMPDAPSTQRSVWSNARESLTASPALRLVAATTVVAALLVLPFQRLVTPLVASIRPEAALGGVAGVLAAGSLGMVLAPRIIRGLDRSRDESVAMLLGLVAAGICVGLFGVAGGLPVTPLQLLLLLGTAFLLGACRQVYASLRASVTDGARGGESQIGDLATIALVGRLVFPAGLLLWGLLMDLTPTAVLLAAFGAITVGISLLLLGRTRSLPTPSGGGHSRAH